MLTIDENLRHCGLAVGTAKHLCALGSAQRDVIFGESRIFCFEQRLCAAAKWAIYLCVYFNSCHEFSRFLWLEPNLNLILGRDAQLSIFLALTLACP